MPQQPAAFHHDDIETVVGVAEDGLKLPLQQLVDHLAAGGADGLDGHSLGEAHGGIEFAQLAQGMHRVRHAGTGEAPTADRGADQAARLGRAWQPLAEQGQVEPLNAQRLGTASRTGDHMDVGWL